MTSHQVRHAENSKGGRFPKGKKKKKKKKEERKKEKFKVRESKGIINKGELFAGSWNFVEFERCPDDSGNVGKVLHDLSRSKWNGSTSGIVRMYGNVRWCLDVASCGRVLFWPLVVWLALHACKGLAST